jgi:hypothetical protein
MGLHVDARADCNLPMPGPVSAAGAGQRSTPVVAAQVA